MKHSIRWLRVVVGVAMLAAGVVAAAAAHPPVTVRTSTGSVAGSFEAYSPRATCAGCHISNCITTNTIPTNAMKWCETEADRAAYAAAHPSNPTPDYGNTDSFTTHVQGVIDGPANTVYWQAYQVKSFGHGVSAGRHSNQGRNESYTNTNRIAYGDPFFTSSPGMFGKY